MKQQMGRLLNYLDCLPITIISIDNIEADDTIAYLTTDLFQPKNSEVIIMSDDKDFLQLINDKVSVWRPVEKKFYGPKEVEEKFGVPSHNFIHYKVFMGDGSDNIKGFKGVGIKTLQGKFPLLLENTVVTLEDVIEYCKQNQDVHRVYKNVLDMESTLKLNWDLMSLKDLNISANFKMLILDMANRPISNLDVYTFKRMFMLDKVYNVIPNVDSWLSNSFGSLNAYANKK
jgi:DNA polymerase-1